MKKNPKTKSQKNPQKKFTIAAFMISFFLLTVIALSLFPKIISNEKNENENQKDKNIFEIQSLTIQRQNTEETQEYKEVIIQAEIADTQEKRNIGLMNRKELPQNIQGMLFVFEDKVRSGFWMKDTFFPLSIAFLDEDGRIQEIINMDPCSEEAQNQDCPVYYPVMEYKYALEVEKGFFEEQEIRTGDSIKGLP
jgi:uncharacterized membrane protein (UPF0127 family)